MEKQSKYLIVLLLIFTICIGVFLYQYNNDVATFIIVNETQVAENGSFSGVLMDAYGQGVANKTISFQKPDNQIVNIKTSNNGEFTIENAIYLSNNSNQNYYRNFTFAGDDKYNACIYEGNVTVIAK